MHETFIRALRNRLPQSFLNEITGMMYLTSGGLCRMGFQPVWSQPAASAAGEAGAGRAAPGCPGTDASAPGRAVALHAGHVVLLGRCSWMAALILQISVCGSPSRGRLQGSRKTGPRCLPFLLWSWRPLGILGLLLTPGGSRVTPSAAAPGGDAAVGSHDPQLLLGSNR